ncbi:hypothetical protein B0A48_02358 [Cryoendolithus antarcticus]|uniref:FAD-binding FR-type domain-containing protein n=1 Tax=Cryoendolithus antarcticus TaxID=1507870 RepID=A0A1V8TNL0_9PEZI|nr:hypothetical protein B0A48_02358 [Cryoendolithus antarcticus]
MDGPIDTAAENFQPLSDAEIKAFFHDIDKDNNGYVTFDELEAKLHAVHEELAPKPQKHNLNHPARKDIEKGSHNHASDGLHTFLLSIMPDCSAHINEEDFVERVRTWQVPSQKQTDTKEEEAQEKERKMPFRRRLRAYWAVHGPTYVFMACVVALQLAMGLWQMIIYIKNPLARAALGWGIIVAKACAGVLYPTLFFMLLSMSRHFATFLRRSRIISRFVNWDYSQTFHIYMSIAGLSFATLHAIGHLAGSMVMGSQPGRQDAVARYLGPGEVPLTPLKYVSKLPGWTGLVALGLFWTISLMSMPVIRNWSYEAFQLAHLLMFPMIGLLCAHGTAAILQAPMMGYWLAFPALLVIFERSWRFTRGFMNMRARIKLLDDDAVAISIKEPRGRDWTYSAGQYILLQVPSVSFFQWHPFTISACRGSAMQVHIKLDGDWTNALRDYCERDDVRDQGDGWKDVKVGVDGPFGAPAQRFYDYDYSIIIGGGIGITPFSAILTDLEGHHLEQRDPWQSRRGSRSLSRGRSIGRESRRGSKPSSTTIAPPVDLAAAVTEKVKGSKPRIPPTRRVDFHWSVRDKTNLLWFSDLLNRALSNTDKLANKSDLDLNIHTHITMKRKNISTHVFCYLLDSYRTESAPYSALTGLKQPSHFGRPDFDEILESHMQELIDMGITEKKVGVFYCGTPVVGEILSDRCHLLTAKARDMGIKIRYDFLMEVFG